MLITPHIHYFVLVSAVLISAVHAIPIQPGAQPEAHHRTPVRPGSPLPSHPETSRMELPKSKWRGTNGGIAEYRATVLEYELDTDTSPTKIPRVGSNNVLGSVIGTLLGKKPARGRVVYINEFIPWGTIPEGASAHEANTEEARARAKMTIFVLEANSDDSTVLCGGDWPCLGWIRLDTPHFYSMYHMNQNVELERIKHDGDEDNVKMGKEMDTEFWKLCSREEFEKTWPLLKQGINIRHNEILEKMKAEENIRAQNRRQRKSDKEEKEKTRTQNRQQRKNVKKKASETSKA
ncbi:hypothetical protein BDP27DRAFT_1362490 [Rhodocollybia butyracea]|uniref:Uncharacterized protein n=1 Tax=Rhodocollybia butyracea TaxID=206335 RepID=A0A9P5PZ10_9AGAR|nr:hypothetical protein BDP27DRAFT_1362490 [Rhodocollybia butyracea]